MRDKCGVWEFYLTVREGCCCSEQVEAMIFLMRKKSLYNIVKSIMIRSKCAVGCSSRVASDLFCMELTTNWKG